MPLYHAVPEDRVGSEDMPGLELLDQPFAVQVHDRPLWKAHKQLPRKRDQFENGASVSDVHRTPRTKVSDRFPPIEPLQISKSRESLSNPPALPLTPPAISQELSEDQNSSLAHDSTHIPSWTSHPSRLSTPTNQRSPPTPDITPPKHTERPLLLEHPRPQPSMSSRAESFKTAREDMSSDEEADRTDTPSQLPSRQTWLRTMQLSHLNQLPSAAQLEFDNDDATPTEKIPNRKQDSSAFASFDGAWTGNRPEEKSSLVSSPTEATDIADFGQKPASEFRQAGSRNTPKSSDTTRSGGRSSSSALKRDRSLRERMQETKHAGSTPSMENFGEAIGWSSTNDSSEPNEKSKPWRWSGASATSTIEAIVIDSPPQPPRTLRHTEKNASLRSASSPIPQSNRSSWNSASDSQRRLTHKAGRITNNNRWSMNSDISTPMSSYSSPTQQQPERINVVVIPQRRSSLKSSSSSSRRHSASLSQSSGGPRPTTAPDNGVGYFDLPRRKTRNRSDSAPSAADSKADGGRGRTFAPVVPPRSSSLSAPTSRNQSRTASLTAESLKPRALFSDTRSPEEVPDVGSKLPTGITSAPGHSNSPTPRNELSPNEWGQMRPPSAHFTPFSQPSIQSSSPGAIEISEARAISLFPHNNRSLLVVEQSAQAESPRVQELRRSAQQLQLNVEPSTPTSSAQPTLMADSPLKNPREPPKPPAFKVIPPTPAANSPTEEADRQLGRRPHTSDGKSGFGRRFGSVRRALSARRYSESLGRSFSLRDARNRKADQHLDSNLHPFWRPRGFWDDFSESSSDGDYPQDDIIVNNSLGMPQKRIIFDGPLSLVRRISGSQRSSPSRSREHAVRRKTSYGSITRRHMRPGRPIHTVPALGLQFQFVGLRDMQERMQKIRQKREEQRREKRREELRQSIGHNVIARGDSRFV